MSEAFCGEVSTSAGESLSGTAAPLTHAWIGLEVRGTWARAAIDSPSLVGGPSAAISGWLERIPGSRLQLIRRPQESSQPRLFLSSTAPAAQWAIEIVGDSLETLCAIDVPEVFERGGHPRGVPAGRLVWICTHGKRDRCCALYGLEVFAEASRLAPSQVWQTSHLGGHRFAATAVVLPRGICFGRLGAGDVGAWLKSDERGELHRIDQVRGRAAYDPATQAAEIHLWTELGERNSDGFRLITSEQTSDDAWLVCFATAERELTVRTVRESTGTKVLGSCSDSEMRAAIRWSCSVQ